MLESAEAAGDLARLHRALTFSMWVAAGWTSGTAERDTQEAFEGPVQEALRRICATRGTEPLVTALESYEWRLDRKTLIAVLAERKDPSLAGTFIRAGACSALLALGTAAVEPALAAVGDSNLKEDARLAAIDVLDQFGEPRAAEVLIKATGSPWPTIANSAALTLAKLRVREAVPAILKMLDRFQPHEMSAVLRSLVALGDAAAIPAIERAMSRIGPYYEPGVRERFSRALDELRESRKALPTPPATQLPPRWQRPQPAVDRASAAIPRPVAWFTPRGWLPIWRNSRACLRGRQLTRPGLDRAGTSPRPRWH